MNHSIAKILAIFFILTMPHFCNGQDNFGQVIAYAGGNVWNGIDFTERTLFVREGLLVGEVEAPDSTVQLDGDFVIPPFGDAHTHTLGVGGYSIYLARQLFVSKGIFYGLDLTNPYSEIKEIRDEFAKPMTMDVAFANGGITSTGSHPTLVMERIFTDTEEVTLDNLTLLGDAYWFLDSVADVNEQWSEIMDQQPDVIKVYLTYVSQGIKEGKCYGLCPDVLRAVVKKAHIANKRVFAHVNTEDDVKLALNAGVEALAHLPSGNDGISTEDKEFWLSDETIQRIGQDSLIVTPTASLLIEDANPDILKNEIAKQREQLRKLYEAGARIALGADEWKKTSYYEIMYLHENQVFDNRTLLRLWTETTPRTIFPNRKIARLKEGYEASFLVLENNPLVDLDAVKDIRMGIKEGHLLIEPSSE